MGKDLPVLSLSMCFYYVQFHASQQIGVPLFKTMDELSPS